MPSELGRAWDELVREHWKDLWAAGPPVPQPAAPRGGARTPFLHERETGSRASVELPARVSGRRAPWFPDRGHPVRDDAGGGPAGAHGGKEAAPVPPRARAHPGGARG